MKNLKNVQIFFPGVWTKIRMGIKMILYLDEPKLLLSYMLGSSREDLLPSLWVFRQRSTLDNTASFSLCPVLLWGELFGEFGKEHCPHSSAPFCLLKKAHVMYHSPPCSLWEASVQGQDCI